MIVQLVRRTPFNVLVYIGIIMAFYSLYPMVVAAAAWVAPAFALVVIAVIITDPNLLIHGRMSVVHNGAA